MKVKELIEQLKKVDPEAIVVGYSSLEEIDFEVEGVNPIVLKNPDDEDEIDRKRRYTKDDSYAEELLLEGKKIVYLQDEKAKSFY